MATLYAGMEARVTVSAADFDDITLTQTEVPFMRITIWDIDGVTKLVDEQDMLWDPAFMTELVDGSTRTGAWHYLWVTPTTPPGAYLVRVEAFASALSVPAWTFKTVRTRANKAA